MTTHQRVYQKRMIAEGRCPHCGKPGGYCERYKQYSREYQNKIKEGRRKRGECVTCGTPCAPYKYCERCRKRSRERMRNVRITSGRVVCRCQNFDFIPVENGVCIACQLPRAD